MLSLKFIQDNPEFVIERLAVKQFDAREIVNQVIANYERRNQNQIEIDSLKASLNKISKEIGQLLKEGKSTEAEDAKAKTIEIKEAIKKYETSFSAIDQELARLQVLLPNIPSSLVPEGRTPEDNVIVESGGEKPILPEGAKPHWDLAAQYNLIDFELGVKSPELDFLFIKEWEPGCSVL
jgi:seryl-tRNA synthetase